MKCGVCCGVVGGVYCGAIGLYNLVEPKRLVVVNTSMSMSNWCKNIVELGTFWVV